MARWLFPVFLLLGLRTGVFTPSEIGAFAVVYALIVGLAIYRELGQANFLDAMENSLSDVGSVMFLIALSAIFSYGIVFQQVPDLISGLILGATEQLYAAMVLIAVFILMTWVIPVFANVFDRFDAEVGTTGVRVVGSSVRGDE